MGVSAIPVIKYRVILSPQERSKLLKLVSKRTESARKILHANILLAADENESPKLSEREIAERFHVNYQTVHTVRKTYATSGLDTALGRKKRDKPPVPAKITGDIEARIIALSCSEPPDGRDKWTLRLLANKAVELQYIDSISHEAVGRLLKKRAQAALEEMLGDTTQTQCSFCGLHGGCSGCILPAV